MGTRGDYKEHKRLDKQPERLGDLQYLYDVYLYDGQNKKRIKVEKTFDDKTLIGDGVRLQKLMRPKASFVVDRRPKQC